MSFPILFWSSPLLIHRGMTRPRPLPSFLSSASPIEPGKALKSIQYIRTIFPSKRPSDLPPPVPACRAPNRRLSSDPPHMPGNIRTDPHPPHMVAVGNFHSLTECWRRALPRRRGTTIGFRHRGSGPTHGIVDGWDTPNVPIGKGSDHEWNEMSGF